MKQPTAEQVAAGRLQVLAIFGILLLSSLVVSIELVLAGEELGRMHFIRPVVLVTVGTALHAGHAWAKWITAVVLGWATLILLMSAISLGFLAGGWAVFVLVLFASVYVGIIATLIGSGSIQAVIDARTRGVRYALEEGPPGRTS